MLLRIINMHQSLLLFTLELLALVVRILEYPSLRFGLLLLLLVMLGPWFLRRAFLFEKKDARWGIIPATVREWLRASDHLEVGEPRGRSEQAVERPKTIGSPEITRYTNLVQINIYAVNRD